MKSFISRLHDIRRGNPATKEEIIQMAEDLINVQNSHLATVAYFITTSETHKYCTIKFDVASWEKKRGSEVIELTTK